MFFDSTRYSANTVKPSIDAAAKVNGFECNVYYKRTFENITQVTGRGDFGTNDKSYYYLPDFSKVLLLIENQTKAGFKGANKTDNPKAIETLDPMPDGVTNTSIVTYNNQYNIEWEPLMKIEVFYHKHQEFPDIVYQTTKVMEVPLANNGTIHSGLIRVYLAPMM